MAERQRKIKVKKCSICETNVHWEWGNKPEKCPHCHSIKFDKPLLEAQLFNQQKQFLDSGRDPERLNTMFPTLKEYARRIVQKNLTGNMRYDETKIESKSSDTANKLVEYYLEKPAFAIFESFGFYLDKIAKQNLFAQKIKNRDQKEFSMEEYIERHEQNSNAIDALQLESEEESEKQNVDQESGINRNMLVDEALQFLERMFESIVAYRGYKVALYQLVLLQGKISGRSKSFFQRAWKVHGQEYKEVYDGASSAFHEFLKKAYEGKEYGSE